jgi:hypothetical protein
MISRLHHACVLTSNAGALGATLSDLFGFPATEVRAVSTDAFSLGTTMVPVGNGSYLQLLQPGSGPGVAELASYGDGFIYEVAFQVSDASRAWHDLRERGITPVDIAGRPLRDGCAVAASGSRYLYLRPADAGGLRVELIEPAA